MNFSIIRELICTGSVGKDHSLMSTPSESKIFIL